MTKNKIWKLVISFVAAVVFWVYVVSVVSPGTEMTFYDIEVKIMDKAALENEGLILTDYDKTVTVRLEGNRSDLSLLNKGNLQAYAYVAGSTPEDTHIEYTINLPDSVAGNAIVVQKKNPEKLNIKIEKLETKMVPVKLIIEGALPENYIMWPENPKEDLVKVLNYTQIQVVGPESLVSRIDNAAITLDITDRTTSIDEDYAFVLCDQDGKPVEADPSLIKVPTTEKVHVSIPILLCKELPMEVKRNPGGGVTEENCQVTIGPVKSVMVAGPKETLEKMDKLVIHTVDLKDMTEDMAVTILLPELLEKSGLKLLSTDVTEVSVMLTLKDIAVKTITIDADQINVNNPENRKYNIAGNSVTITVRGPASLVSKLTEKDITVTLDLTGAQANGPRAFATKVTFTDAFNAVAVMEKTEILVEVSS